MELFERVKVKVIMPEEKDDYYTEVDVPADANDFFIMDLKLDPRFAGCVEVVKAGR